MINTCILGDSQDVLKTIESNSIDMVITSPPYDNLRSYNGEIIWNFDVFKNIALELARVIKVGGVIVWNVADSVKNGSETLSSFKQAIFFNEVTGLRLHDTMIYLKNSYVPLNHNRYEQSFEYIFCFSKYSPKTFNPKKIPCVTAGTKRNRTNEKQNEQSYAMKKGGHTIVKDTKIAPNHFIYDVGKNEKTMHNAPFPYQLAADQIKTWTNEQDIILDPFAGSGTSLIAARDLNRKFIGIEKVEKYHQLIVSRLSEKTI